MKIQVSFPDGPRMWPADVREPDKGGAGVLTPIDNDNWRFAITHGGRWKAYRRQRVP